ncbi:MAG: RNA polymerase subunit sigma [Candidatus Latescibacterota bacterium]|nr:MAG: RNA polymerase subunit sigma [Candidatus Latescibacterota bacterium]
MQAILERARGARVVVLTGAGISAESGIPTFRGPEGLWTIGSREYQPQEIATWGFFERQPDAVWSWYLYRRSICQQAQPNAGHRALVDLETLLQDRFRLVTQNVDGLHLRAGNSAERTYSIHGNLDFARCAAECVNELVPMPLHGAWARGCTLGPREREALHCRHCGSWLRPHVLWFDETYDEPRYRYESSIGAVSDAALLIVVGTSGATTLPMQMGMIAANRGVAIIDVNPETNPFSRLAQAAGVHVAGPAARVLPELVRAFRASADADRQRRRS